MPPTGVTSNLLLTTNNLAIAHNKDHQQLNQDMTGSSPYSP